jgi:hypothetical protein
LLYICTQVAGVVVEGEEVAAGTATQIQTAQHSSSSSSAIMGWVMQMGKRAVAEVVEGLRVVVAVPRTPGTRWGAHAMS